MPIIAELTSKKNHVAIISYETKFGARVNEKRGYLAIEDPATRDTVLAEIQAELLKPDSCISLGTKLCSVHKTTEEITGISYEVVVS